MEQVAQVRLDRPGTEEECFGDLGVRSPVHDESCDLKFARGLLWERPLEGGGWDARCRRR